MVMFIGVSLGGRRRYRVKSSEEEKCRLKKSDLGVRIWSDWLVDSRGILLEHKGTKRHVFLRVEFK